MQGGGEMNVMKIKSDNKVSIVQAHSQGSFLLVNPSIPTSYSHMTVLLEFESNNYYITH